MTKIVGTSELDELWDKLRLCFVEAPVDFKDLQNIFHKLMQFIGVAVSNKKHCLRVIRDAEPDAETYMKEVRAGILKNMHYNERTLYRRLALPESVGAAYGKIENINLMLEACKSFERLLQSYNEAMRLDLKLSFEGHE